MAGAAALHLVGKDEIRSTRWNAGQRAVATSALATGGGRLPFLLYIAPGGASCGSRWAPRGRRWGVGVGVANDEGKRAATNGSTDGGVGRAARRRRRSDDAERGGRVEVGDPTKSARFVRLHFFGRNFFGWVSFSQTQGVPPIENDDLLDTKTKDEKPKPKGKGTQRP